MNHKGDVGFIFFFIVIMSIFAFIAIYSFADQKRAETKYNNFCKDKGYNEYTDYRIYPLMVECDDEERFKITQTHKCKELDKWGECKGKEYYYVEDLE